MSAHGHKWLAILMLLRHALDTRVRAMVEELAGDILKSSVKCSVEKRTLIPSAAKSVNDAGDAGHGQAEGGGCGADGRHPRHR